jgi:hypothetical protein
MPSRAASTTTSAKAATSFKPILSPGRRSDESHARRRRPAPAARQ